MAIKQKWDVEILFDVRDDKNWFLEIALFARANPSIRSITAAFWKHLSKSINIVDGSINHSPDDIAEMKATGKFIEFKITPTTH